MISAFQIVSLLTDGVIFGVLALGIFVAFRWLRFPDLTPDGSFTVGAAVYVVSTGQGINPFLSAVLSMCAGVCCGLTTAGISRVLRVPSVVSGLIVSSALYSIVWMLLRGPNRPLGTAGSMSFKFEGIRAAIVLLAVCAILLIVVIGGLYCFAQTIWGLRMRAIGENAPIATDLKATVGHYDMIGLGIANSLAALSGLLMVQRSYAVDLNMGVGITVAGIAGMMVGSALAGRAREASLLTLVAIVIGSLIERAISFTTLIMGVPGPTFRLVSAGILIVVFVVMSTRSGDVLRGLRWN